MQSRWLFSWLIVLLFVGSLWAQDFGQNKVQYQDKNWEYIQSEHFDLYYYQGARHLAEFAADIAESAYVQLSHTFNYKLVDRVPIIIYRSHNDFSETNLSGQVVEESVGGFTEFLKNRVVLPFEGDYEMFRHVIHHELTHAVQMQFLYGSGPGAIIQGATKMMPPTWFIEGQAEFQSLGWDTDSDMFVRDATLRGYLPPIQYLQAFLAYKGGQSVWLYIDETFGAQKRTELLQRIKGTRNFERAWRSALNESLDETSEKWQRWMRKKYWPEIADRKEPTDYAQRLTDHKKWGNFINNNPAISPTGDRVAFLTERTGYFDIYIVHADGKQFVTVNFDLRHYVFLSKDYSLAMRVTGGASFGKNPTLFILGGVDNWLNYHFYNNININSIQDYFLSDFLTPLRGADLYQLVGTRAALMNIEFRFPFIKYFVGSFPLPLGFQNIMGNAFLDAGSAWSKDSAWKFIARKPDGSRYVNDQYVVTGFGYGIRAYLFGLVLRLDAAWQTDFNRVTSPRYYWSLGLDF
jgi:hypothetical protein